MTAADVEGFGSGEDLRIVSRARLPNRHAARSEIVAFRAFDFSPKARELYNLPHGLDGDVEDPTQPAPSPERTAAWTGQLSRCAPGR